MLTRTNHQARTVNFLFTDGHAATLDNTGQVYTINPLPLPEVAFDLILTVFETADEK